MRTIARWTIGVALTVAAVEGGLRLHSPVLPSLRGGVGPFVPAERPAVVALEPDVVGCVELDANGDAPKAWVRRFGAGDEPGHRILFAGDSVTLGQGVRPSETYAGLIGAAYANAYGVPVEVVNAGVNAAGYCGVIRAVHHHQAKAEFQKTVVTLFADDLEQRAVLLEGDRVRANPRAIDGLVAAVASRSHLFNWVWHAAVSKAVEHQTRVGGAPPAHIMLPGRSVPKQTLDNLHDSIKGLSHVNPVWLLVPPAGLSLCPTPADPTSECGWMAADMDRIAEVLDAAQADWVDLRTIHEPSHVLDAERAWWNRDGRLPVHPNAAGHAALAGGARSAVLKR